MTEPVLCSHCNKPIALNEVYTCSQCNKFFCGNCTIQKNEKLFCVLCYSSRLSDVTKKTLKQILARKGVKIELPKLVFNGMQIKELSEVRINNDKWEFKVRCIDKEKKTFTVDRETFDQLWKKAQELGYETEKIPFGQRVII